MSVSDNPIPEHLLGYYRVLRQVFPQGVREDEYFPLLAVLRENLGLRSTARLISLFTGRDYWRAYNDALSVEDNNIPNSSSVESIRKRLFLCGYKE